MIELAEEVGCQAFNLFSSRDPSDKSAWRVFDGGRLTDPPQTMARTRERYGMKYVEDLLADLRKENKLGGNVYFRPAASSADSIASYRYLFLDDVPRKTAFEIADFNRCFVIETSPNNCQIWLITNQRIDGRERQRLQAILAQKVGADRAATSGIQPGRIPGFKNHKRGGCWVNVLKRPKGKPLDVETIKPAAVTTPANNPRPKKSAVPVGGSKPLPPVTSNRRPGKTQSEVDFQWTILKVKEGVEDEEIVRLLAISATRKGRSAEKYARRTLAAAKERLFPS